MRILVLLLLAGCLRSFAPEPKRISAPLPDRADKYDAASARKRSAVATYLAFDQQFRTNVRNYGELTGVNGVDQLRYPESSHPDAAHAYVRLGNASAAAKRWGDAAQAYWAALGLTSKTLASRRQREELRRATYLGLAEVATTKQQSEWAALLRLCAGLADTYLTSEIADAHHDQFYTALEGQLRTQRAAEAQEARARRSLLLQRIAAGVSVAATVTAGATGAMSQAQVNSQSAQIGQQLAAADQQERELNTAMQEAMGAISQAVGQLREVSAGDIPEIQAGRSFVAAQVGWYLLAAKDPLRYFDGPLASYAKGRAPLRRAVEAARAAFAAGGSAAPRSGFAVGDTVDAQWTDGSWYPGKVAAVHGNGSVDIDFDDGDHSSKLSPSKVRRRGEAGAAAGPTDAQQKAIAELALAFVAVERHVAIHERNQAVPLPQYVASSCSPEGGAIECFMAAGDLCRAGIEEGCTMLGALVKGNAP